MDIFTTQKERHLDTAEKYHVCWELQRAFKSTIKAQLLKKNI